ncbi:MAG: flavodoxin family protein [Desulfovibrio sp.]|nr:flavodoxin family protein [Desulfovibrio sp.]
MGNIVVLAGSSRVNGNTDILAKSFADGAKEHNTVEIISVAKYKIYPCIGCNSCKRNEENKCFQNDDMHIVYDKLKHADILVIASPVYFYGLSAQLKAIIDRFHNPVRNSFPIKKLGLILVGADVLPELFDSIIAQYDLTRRYFGLDDIGKVLVRGAEAKGDVHKTDGVRQAFELGKSLR